MKLKRIFLLFLSTFFLIGSILSFAPTNFYQPYDINLRMFNWDGANLKFRTDFEYGCTTNCRDWDENKTNVLRIYNKTESALAMLLGAPVGSDINNLANSLIPAFNQATDDGNRGRFLLSGKFEQMNLNFVVKYRLPIKAIPGNFDLFLYIPFKYMQINNVNWCDLTKNELDADLDVHNYLTDDIYSVAKELGDLDIAGWNRFGISDIVCMLNWSQDFKQRKEHLKNVRINLKVGLSAPSGKEKDEDKALSLPMGNDGSWGVPLGIGLDLDFIRKVRAGIEFEMLFLFDKTRLRRLKTDVRQTDYLLLNKGEASKDSGVAYKFNLFVQAKHFLRGLSAMLAYQFFKHDSDTLTANSNDFSYSIINSAQSLQEWNSQNFIFQLNYDFFKECKNSKIKPQISFFYKLPVIGKRVLNPHIFGGQIALNF